MESVVARVDRAVAHKKQRPERAPAASQFRPSNSNLTPFAKLRVVVHLVSTSYPAPHQHGFHLVKVQSSRSFPTRLGPCRQLPSCYLTWVIRVIVLPRIGATQDPIMKRRVGVAQCVDEGALSTTLLDL